MEGTQFIGILATNLLQMDEVFHHVFCCWFSTVIIKITLFNKRQHISKTAFRNTWATHNHRPQICGELRGPPT